MSVGLDSQPIYIELQRQDDEREKQARTAAAVKTRIRCIVFCLIVGFILFLVFLLIYYKVYRPYKGKAYYNEGKAYVDIEMIANDSLPLDSLNPKDCEIAAALYKKGIGYGNYDCIDAYLIIIGNELIPRTPDVEKDLENLSSKVQDDNTTQLIELSKGKEELINSLGKELQRVTENFSKYSCESTSSVIHLLKEIEKIEDTLQETNPNAPDNSDELYWNEAKAYYQIALSGFWYNAGLWNENDTWTDEEHLDDKNQADTQYYIEQGIKKLNRYIKRQGIHKSEISLDNLLNMADKVVYQQADIDSACQNYAEAMYLKGCYYWHLIKPETTWIPSDNDALNCWLLAAYYGNKDAASQLAELVYYGLGRYGDGNDRYSTDWEGYRNVHQKNLKRAELLADYAIKLKNPHAHTILARIYQDKKMGEDAVIEQIEKAREEGDLFAGCLYYILDIEKVSDISPLLNSYHGSLEVDKTYDPYVIAHMGDMVENDNKKLEYWEEAAKMGCEVATYKLADYYAHTKHDKKKAKQYAELTMLLRDINFKDAYKIWKNN